MGRFLQRYWGFLALVLAILGWSTLKFGYTLILISSLAALVYFLVQALLTCCAEIRTGDHCRNNSHGFLLGCWIRQHKRQRARDIFVSRKWQDIVHYLTGLAKGYPRDHRRPCVNRVTLRSLAPRDLSLWPPRSLPYMALFLQRYRHCSEIGTICIVGRSCRPKQSLITRWTKTTMTGRLMSRSLCSMFGIRAVPRLQSVSSG